MSNHSLIWAAVPHNSDGVVFQARILHGFQRFHVSRRVLEEVFGIERKASDARQLEVFYAVFAEILSQARDKRSIAGSDTVALVPADFLTRDRTARAAHADAGVRRLQ
ncbi:hypothetical protein [Paraburkholderia sp. J12]|uniref:hypothetical protein n=1 Tax=Paraburkholderia sp. J12 TaxID=2805432 RepID=UPI002ABE7EA1|nr:hypothetical protein [Paraburkholderia sp. J12]